MTPAFFIFASMLAFIPLARADEGVPSRQECVNEAQRKYDSCMELAAEILAEAPQKGITTTQHTLEEGKNLREGGCKKMFEEDLKKCPAS